MDYVRQTVDSEILIDIFDLPASLMGRKVEVIILPAQEPKESASRLGASFGCLRKYADVSKIPEESGAWERAVSEKYADR